MGQKLGQHFLKSQKALDAMVRAGNVSKDDTILEIGPGKGVLTQKLLEYAGKVVAVEKDPELAAHLQEKFTNEIEKKRLILIPEDIRDFHITDYELPITDYKLIANIPYYLTGHILRQFLAADHKPKQMVLLVQKEIANRIVAKKKKPFDSAPFDSAQGKESILSISVKAFGTPVYEQKVPARSFSPPPKVDSAIISISNISSPFNSSKEEAHFFDLLHKGFGHKRKLLKSNIGCGSETLARCGIAEQVRAENVTLDQWMCLAKQDI